MRHTRSLLAALSGVVVTVGALGVASACEGMEQTAMVRSLNADQLALAMQIHPSLTILDVNGTDTRAKLGVIPGAVLVSGPGSFDPAKELPADKSNILVFYCSSESCSAAPTAAQRAIEAGWVNVYVLDAGIRGWSQSGRPTAKAASAKPASTRPSTIRPSKALPRDSVTT
jgi:rhodanese-related sulfurtransferase